jgi:prepilin-type N-terminal cleavage/methylation domain-containing protein
MLPPNPEYRKGMVTRNRRAELPPRNQASRERETELYMKKLLNYRGRNTGFTLVEIMIVVAIIGLLAAIAVPNFVKARSASQVNACIANLKQMEGAKATWALENKKTSTDTPVDTDLFGATTYIKDKPECPGGGDYTLGAVQTKTACSLAGSGHSL